MAYTLLFAGQPIGYVEFGPPDPRGHRIGTLAPTTAYLEVRPIIRRLFDAIGAMAGARPMDIHHELVARHGELREAGLSLADAAGAPVDAWFLAVVDVLPLTVDDRAVLQAGLLQVGATFGGAASPSAPAT